MWTALAPSAGSALTVRRKDVAGASCGGTFEAQTYACRQGMPQTTPPAGVVSRKIIVGRAYPVARLVMDVVMSEDIGSEGGAVIGSCGDGDAAAWRCRPRDRHGTPR